jgi:hypothetical protein
MKVRPNFIDVCTSKIAGDFHTVSIACLDPLQARAAQSSPALRAASMYRLGAVLRHDGDQAIGNSVMAPERIYAPVIPGADVTPLAFSSTRFRFLAIIVIAPQGG